MDSYVDSEHPRLALQLVAVTFVRTSKLLGVRWSEFDMTVAQWTIPVHEMMEAWVDHLNLRRGDVAGQEQRLDGD